MPRDKYTPDIYHWYQSGQWYLEVSRGRNRYFFCGYAYMSDFDAKLLDLQVLYPTAQVIARSGND